MESKNKCKHCGIDIDPADGVEICPSFECAIKESLENSQFKTKMK